MWTFIISKITSIKHLKPFGEIPFVMMITRWWRIILHNPLLTPDVLKLGKSVPVPVAEFSISFISFWDNHLFVYSDEHYRWCSKFCINRNKIDLASVKRESGELLKHLLEIAWSQLSDHLLKRRRRRKYHQFIVEWWQHVPDTLHWSHFLGSRSNHLKCTV